MNPQNDAGNGRASDLIQEILEVGSRTMFWLEQILNECDGDTSYDPPGRHAVSDMRAMLEKLVALRSSPGSALFVVEGFRCERCCHTWRPRSLLAPHPRVCPKCKSPYWNRPRRTQVSTQEQACD